MNDTNTKNKDGDAVDAKASGDEAPKKTLGLKGKGTLSLKGNAATQAKQNLQGRGDVPVEVKRRRSAASIKAEAEAKESQDIQSGSGAELRQLTSDERQARAEALKKAIEGEKSGKDESQRPKLPPREVPKDSPAEAAAAPAKPEKSSRELELEELRRIEEEEQRKQAERKSKYKEKEEFESSETTIEVEDDEGLSYRERMRRAAKKTVRKPAQSDDARKTGRITVSQAINKDYERDRGPSMAARRRAREKARLASQGPMEPPKKVTRDVTVPETITVQELANRMAERSADVVKELMKMGVMATVNQTIDADTAELVVGEFGHKIIRVTDADVEIGLEDIMDEDQGSENILPRPPVVTIMGHVDHGKTSLLDAMRQTSVVAGEAGGITQHIGAYQIETKGGDRITFVDTPGHAAFTEMRARGADITDIVVLVVAANDSIMPQTIEAISHAKAAGKPIVVAINKCDLPDADPNKVKQDLLNHEIVVEDFSGDAQSVEVSALKGEGLEALEEAILLQSEILELKADPKREARGAVVESKQEKGRGSVATILVQKGTLKIGDIFVAGAEWGRVRALIDDKGRNIKEAGPSLPVEVLGLNGTPNAGDVFIVVEDETKAKEVSEYRKRKLRERQAALVAGTRSSFDAMLAKAREDEKEGLPVIIKSDVHGSLEALASSLHKLNEDNEEVNVRILHSAVGGITESDVQLAKASGALVIGFNVRANNQAREMASREAVNIQYYNIIYNVLDDVKGLLTGMLSPVIREEYIGQAEIREVFNITKVGKVAGCMVTDGAVRRGNKVRLLRDNVVIHEGTLKTLKRFKDEVKDVKEGMECGMAFENYDDIKPNDIIECYEVIEEARELNT